MGNLFSYKAHIMCSKSKRENLLKYFEEKSYCCDGLYCEDTYDGVIIRSACKNDLYSLATSELLKLSKKANAKIRMFGYDETNEMCHYLYVEKGDLLEDREGWCFDICEDNYDEEDFEENIKYINEFLFGKNKKNHLTLKQLKKKFICVNDIMFEFYCCFPREEIFQDEQ